MHGAIRRQIVYAAFVVQLRVDDRPLTQVPVEQQRFHPVRMLLIRPEVQIGVRGQIPVNDVVVMRGRQTVIPVGRTNQIYQAALERFVVLVVRLLRKIPRDI